MSYEKAITIKEAVNNINKKYVLPSIQREFEWTEGHIEMLFDSLMRDYPISTFLFWQVPEDKIDELQFYEFLTEYNKQKQGSNRNKKIDVLHSGDIVAILDGQQRMTSLYLALSSTFNEKFLCLNLFDKLKYEEDADEDKNQDMKKKYDFQFLTTSGRTSSIKDRIFWFDCRKILSFNTEDEVKNYLETEVYNYLETDLGNKKSDAIITVTEETKNKIKEAKVEAKDKLFKLFEVVHSKRFINYYLEQSEELEKVLQIFIRINNQGEPLSRPVLLLSVAAAHWENRDAKEVINSLVDEMNSVGRKFNFTTDLVMKACFVLCSFSAAYKVDNFTKENMAIIEEKWDDIASSLSTAVHLISNFGFYEDNLSSKNAIIPIAYFINENKYVDEILNSPDREEDRKSIREWLTRSLIKGSFGAAGDTIYKRMRELVHDYKGRFPLPEIIKEWGSDTKRDILFTEEHIDGILDSDYSKAKTKARLYCALTLLYPDFDYKNSYEPDYIFTKSIMTKKNLMKEQFTDQRIREYRDKANTLPNFLLLKESTKSRRNDSPFVEWCNMEYLTQDERNNFLEENYIDSQQDLDLDSFVSFIAMRRKKLKKVLMEVLGVRN